MNARMQKLYEDIYKAADRSGMRAAHEAVPPSMTVVVGGGQRFHVAEGACGFGWVVLRPGTHSFCRWLRKQGLASPHHGGGLQVWSRYHGQSVVRNEAYAQAFAKVVEEVFRGERGLRAHAASRLD